MKTKISVATALVLSVLFLAGCQSSARSATTNSTPLLTEAEARDIALKDAGFSVSDISTLHIEKEVDDGLTLYEVSFRQGNDAYDYEIDAATGKIVGFDKDQEVTPTDNIEPVVTKPTEATQNPATTKPAEITISKEKAKSIALSHAGLKESEVAGLKVELERDDGITQYDVEFQNGIYEYSYEINATTGKIIEWEKDIDD